MKSERMMVVEPRDTIEFGFELVMGVSMTTTSGTVVCVKRHGDEIYYTVSARPASHRLMTLVYTVSSGVWEFVKEMRERDGIKILRYAITTPIVVSLGRIDTKAAHSPALAKLVL